MYQGLATTIAGDFRLHLAYNPHPNDPDLPNDWATILSDRVHLFKTLSCVDVMWSSYLGRESGIPRRHVTQPLPAEPENPRDVPLVDLALGYHARLAVIASSGIEEIYNDTFPNVDAHVQACMGYLEAADDWYVSSARFHTTKADAGFVPLGSTRFPPLCGASLSERSS